MTKPTLKDGSPIYNLKGYACPHCKAPHDEYTHVGGGVVDFGENTLGLSEDNSKNDTNLLSRLEQAIITCETGFSMALVDIQRYNADKVMDGNLWCPEHKTQHEGTYTIIRGVGDATGSYLTCPEGRMIPLGLVMEYTEEMNHLNSDTFDIRVPAEMTIDIICANIRELPMLDPGEFEELHPYKGE